MISVFEWLLLRRLQAHHEVYFSHHTLFSFSACQNVIDMVFILQAFMKYMIAIDQIQLHRYFNGTSLLSVSTAGRRAVSSETALAFFQKTARNQRRNV
jgi:hypothetical protein